MENEFEQNQLLLPNNQSNIDPEIIQLKKSEIKMAETSQPPIISQQTKTCFECLCCKNYNLNEYEILTHLRLTRYNDYDEKNIDHENLLEELYERLQRLFQDENKDKFGDLNDQDASNKDILESENIEFKVENYKNKNSYTSIDDGIKETNKSNQLRFSDDIWKLIGFQVSRFDINFNLYYSFLI